MVKARPAASQSLDLFIQTTKDAAIAALEADHAGSAQGLRDEGGVDIGLRGRGAKSGFAHVDAAGRLGDQRQDLGPDEAIVDHHLGGLQRAVSAKRQMRRSAGTGAHKGDGRDSSEGQ